MNLNEKRLSGETIYAGRILTLEVDRVELPNGRQSTREVIRHLQAGGTLWLGGTTWQGMAAMRISVSNWSTTTDDVDRSAAAILAAARAAG